MSTKGSERHCDLKIGFSKIVDFPSTKLLPVTGECIWRLVFKSWGGKCYWQLNYNLYSFLKKTSQRSLNFAVLKVTFQIVYILYFGNKGLSWGFLKFCVSVSGYVWPASEKTPHRDSQKIDKFSLCIGLETFFVSIILPRSSVHALLTYRKGFWKESVGWIFMKHSFVLSFCLNFWEESVGALA